MKEDSSQNLCEVDSVTVDWSELRVKVVLKN
jgi:hypothetical protein